MRGKRLHRLLKIIPLIKSGATSFNARKLAKYFQTSKRNIYRDMAILELAGVPFYYDPEFGEGGGYRIHSKWWFPHVGLTDQECLDLAIIARATESSSIPLLEEVCAVRDRLLGTLPSKQQDLIRQASEFFDILGLNIAEHGHCRRVMTTIQTALLQRQQIRGRYFSPHRSKPVRVSLQPKRCFLAGQAWYLAAHDNKDSETKLFRLAKFQELQLLEKPVTVNTNCSLRELLGNAWTVYRGDRDWHVEIWFAPEAADLVAETRWHHTQEIERQKDGSAIFRAMVSGLEEVKWWALGWGPRAKILKPKELAEEVCSLVGGIIGRYQPEQKGSKAL